MIAIVDYKAGNLTSVKRALDYLKIENQITADPHTVSRAERIVFPGVGHAATAMSVLEARGLDEALQEAFVDGTPILGICLGSQVVLAHSEEGDTPCLALIPGTCPRFVLNDSALKIPHMGWNAVSPERGHFVLKDLRPGDEFYFVHAYYPQPARAEDIFATSEYEVTFPAAIGHANLFATQFHPEKSGEIGLKLLQNFAVWKP
ncbi:MAG: imidazole glycerol phosphate synthase subunit HisH [Chloroflexota bacterium]